MLFLVILNKNKENEMKIEKIFFELTKNSMCVIIDCK